MLKARNLEILCAVIEMGTTARAADALGVSQPAVSNMIRHTEDLIGFPLFLRERGRLTPTREALHLADEARHLFRQQRRIAGMVEELKGGVAGRLSIIATPSLGHGIVPRALSAFLKGRSKVRISFEVGTVDEIAARLIAGEADLGLSITRPRQSALSTQPLADGRLVCVLPEGHELALSDRVRITDLNHVPHISYAVDTPLGRAVDAVFSAEGLERRHFCEVRHTSTALDLVKGGLGVALVDDFALIGGAPPGVVARPATPDVPLKIYALTSTLFPTPNLALLFQRHFADFVGAAPRV
ncbi:LysR family transcriptional regulator [Albimonas pacifica]|uniref:DNA-binding transcriptional regulator, LysR family n=1 Tax=Albimonas pacifica TaxID=1114924 RepID=A0A1I3E9W0_9RHOB|nr:LysR family transcriptional regulator [Albimonas pacifica]SFH95491.1 DNA-binding transcriptional regulator, LysR family [Albimonas pacifica]